ncbi:hypothetical protein PPROV_000190900 [Pycnococcus provasolii]|uniref:Methyltransferase small domain-containing protein n=1 Tax=Pycnococcus provasolii TaxID=41880 RepID=A0A830H7W5_9CHLO|nr:hypothetical protein PPROV_000190900 [Pycnococcus provasolii]
MKVKHLEAMLSDVAPFAKPKVMLEQYPTSAHIASHILFTAQEQFQDIANRTVVDLGTGTGMLAIGASLMGAAHVVGVDIDDDALAIAAENVEENFEDVRPDGPLDLLRCDVRDVSRLRLHADTVLMNPPFGTKRAGADMEFVRSALLGISFPPRGGAVYSLHKTSTRKHVGEVAQRDLGALRADVVAELRYDLPKTYRFHKKESVDVSVDVWRFVVKGGARDDEDATESAGT